jgi:energy-coupling factor transporter ATP-binding protein EcfA2
MDTIHIRPSPETDTGTSRAGKSVNVYEIVSKMHEHNTDLGRFVDREAEAREILGLGRAIRDGEITILYGPKGCGKTTLLLALANTLTSFRGRSTEIHYVSMDEAERNINITSTNKDIMKRLSKRLKDRGYSVSLGASLGIHMVFPAGFSLSISKKEGLFEQMDAIETAMDIVRDIVSRKKGDGKRHVVVIDEYRFLSENDYIELKNHVEIFYNVLKHSINRVLGERGSSLAYIITTSDAAVTKMHVGGSKERYILMWNLPRGATEGIAEGVGVDKELAWKLSGGNPRALTEIRDYGLENWLGTKIVKTLKNLYNELLILRGLDENRVWADLEKAANNIDSVYPDTMQIMLKENIAIYHGIGMKITDLPREPWIGKDYAYQIPAYYYALKAMARKRSTDISPEEVIMEAMS